MLILENSLFLQRISNFSSMIYYNFLTMSFEEFRKFFNKMFSLSLNGKFVGLGRLGDNFRLFCHKLAKLLNRSRMQRPLGDVITFHVGGNVVKLYNR